MFPKNSMTTQLFFCLSLVSLSICHIIRRDAIEETSVVMLTEELSSNEVASVGSNPNEVTYEQDVEDHQEETNEIGNFPQEGYEEGHGGDEEDNAIETSTTSPGETTRDTTTSHDSISSTVAIDTSTSLESQASTTSMEQLQVDVSTDAATTAAAPMGSPTTALNEDEFSIHSEPCYEPPAQQLHLNFKQSNQNVKFPALAILKKENAEDDLVYGRTAAIHQPGDESSAAEHRGTLETYVNTTCPRELLHVSGHDDVNRRSLCPWTYRPDIDLNRYPSKIMFAVCRCPECILAGGGEDGEFSVDNTCRQVFFRMRVLRKGSCVNGLYVYNTEYQDIPVACACVRPKS